MIQQESGTSWREMYEVFNMGHRFEMYVDEMAAEGLIAIAKSFNIDAQVVGRVEASDNTKLTINSPFGAFNW
jgi:phosphoribosylformylglycinamidine cyclo-ligase